METMGSTEIDTLVLKWALSMERNMKEERNKSFNMLMKALFAKERFQMWNKWAGCWREIIARTKKKKVQTIVNRPAESKIYQPPVLLTSFFRFLSLSDSESIWSEWDSDWPVFQNVWPAYPEADRGMEPVLPHQFQSKGGCLWGQTGGHGLGGWLSGLCRGSRRSVLRYRMWYT